MHLVGLSTHWNTMHSTYNVKFPRIIFSYKHANFLHFPPFYRILSTQNIKRIRSTEIGKFGRIFYLQKNSSYKDDFKRNVWRKILTCHISSFLPHFHPLHPGGTRSQNLQKYSNISGNIRVNLTGYKFWDIIFCFNIYHGLTSIYYSVNILF